MRDHTYVYEFYVMDEGWEMFPTVSEVINKLNSGCDDNSFLIIDFLESKTRALEAARNAEVTGGFVTDIHVMPLIDNMRPSYALIWKAGRGGYCIAVSEERLPWIEEIESHTLKLI